MLMKKGEINFHALRMELGRDLDTLKEKAAIYSNHLIKNLLAES